MALEAVGSVVLQKLVEMMNGEGVIIYNLDEIKKVVETTGRSLSNIDDNPETRKRSDKYLEIVYELEDFIEIRFLRMARRRKRLSFLMNNRWLSLFNFPASSKLRQKLAQFKEEVSKLDRNVRVEALAEDKSFSPRVTNSHSPSFADHHLRERRLIFTPSYKEDVNTLVNQLIKNDDLVFSIVGVMGSGKTTCARKIYERRDIKDHFDYRAWVFVSKDYKITDLLLSLLRQLKGLKDQNAPTLDKEEELGDRLLDHIKDKSYLVVLDDVTDTNVWKKLSKYFPATGNRSKIIITTCEDDVPSHANISEDSSFKLGLLSYDTIWKIFVKERRMGTSFPNIPADLQKLIQDICAGLPLKIVLLSGLLSTDERKNPDQWMSFLNSQKKWEMNDILSLSYNDLPARLKLCLLYMVLFPKDLDIPVRRLLLLWKAEGFVERSDGRIPEDVVQGYLDDLVNRKMIEISKWSSDDTARRCRLLGALHDYLLPKAGKIRLFYVCRNLSDEAADGFRRFIDHAYDTNLHPQVQVQFLRSFLSFNFSEKDWPAKGVGIFLGEIISNRYVLLRVLDLEGVYKPTLPENLGKLYNLRYLGLRWTFLDSIPSSVGDLLYLETLDVKHTNINSLPSSIWKSKHLRNLNLNENRLDVPTQPCQQACVSTPTLLTLWGLFINKKSPVKNGLDRLSHLRELGVSFDLNSGQEDLLQWIQSLNEIRSLRLRSRDHTGRPSKLMLKPLYKLLKLATLNLVGNIEKLPDQFFPPNVKVLTLSVSRLVDDPMKVLGELPSLKVLRLLADSYLGCRMRCHREGFPNLRVLKLWMLRNLSEWVLEEGAMKNLKELNIRCCHKLNNIPPGLLKLDNLEDITLINMPQEFAENFRKKESMHVFAPPDWNFTPLPWEVENNLNCTKDGAIIV